MLEEAEPAGFWLDDAEAEGLEPDGLRMDARVALPLLEASLSATMLSRILMASLSLPLFEYSCHLLNAYPMVQSDLCDLLLLAPQYGQISIKIVQYSLLVSGLPSMSPKKLLSE